MESKVISAVLTEIRDYLERAKSEIDEQVRHYPAPIPACDAQFNHLMEQRACLVRDLGRLDVAVNGYLTDEEAAIWVSELLRSATYLEDDVRQAIGRLMLHPQPAGADL